VNWRRWALRVGIGFLTVWAALAQIAPDVFQVNKDSLRGFGWLLTPMMGWILFPLVVIVLVYYFSRLEGRITELSVNAARLWIEHHQEELFRDVRHQLTALRRQMDEQRMTEANLAEIRTGNTHEMFTTIDSDGHIRTWSRREVDQMSDTARQELCTRHKDLREWYVFHKWAH